MASYDPLARFMANNPGTTQTTTAPVTPAKTTATTQGTTGRSTTGPVQSTGGVTATVSNGASNATVTNNPGYPSQAPNYGGVDPTKAVMPYTYDNSNPLTATGYTDNIGFDRSKPYGPDNLPQYNIDPLGWAEYYYGKEFINEAGNNFVGKVYNTTGGANGQPKMTSAAGVPLPWEVARDLPYTVDPSNMKNYQNPTMGQFGPSGAPAVPQDAAQAYFNITNPLLNPNAYFDPRILNQDPMQNYGKQGTGVALPNGGYYQYKQGVTEQNPLGVNASAFGVTPEGSPSSWTDSYWGKPLQYGPDAGQAAGQTNMEILARKIPGLYEYYLANGINLTGEVSNAGSYNGQPAMPSSMLTGDARQQYLDNAVYSPNYGQQPVAQGEAGAAGSAAYNPSGDYSNANANDSRQPYSTVTQRGKIPNGVQSEEALPRFIGGNSSTRNSGYGGQSGGKLSEWTNKMREQYPSIFGDLKKPAEPGPAPNQWVSDPGYNGPEAPKTMPASQSYSPENARSATSDQRTQGYTGFNYPARPTSQMGSGFRRSRQSSENNAGSTSGHSSDNNYYSGLDNFSWSTG